DKFTGHEYLVENVKKIEKVEIIMPAKIVEIYGDKFVDGIKYEKDGSVNDLKVQGIIVEICRVPNTEFVKGFVDIDKHDHISIDCTTAASVPGIFAAGDCSSVHEFQYVIAAGQGCTALLKAARYLAGKKQ
ncbi:FAD-dependent oxidoreductase, partial [Candidatus Woesearchaeota archaeon]|nr:FAD-dependent oxidoreductase [Candidatus Woesearchaeota archaeon]